VRHLALVLVLTACSRSTPPTLSWTLERDGDGLSVHYVVTNGRNHTIWVYDQYVADRAIVSRGEPGTARFVIGYLTEKSQEPEIGQAFDHWEIPGVSDLRAHETSRGAFHVSLPLEPWHWQMRMSPLHDPTRVRLEVGYFESLPDLYKGVPAGGGGEGLRWLISEPRDLPDVSGR
jgi:hypothetical protein